MLASITPLGERGRGQRYWLTTVSFVAGATGGGILAGATAGGIGDLLGLDGLSSQLRLGVLATAMLVGAIVDRSTAFRLPSTRRQVDASWLTTYRGWVYGGGFGAQLGVGVGTIVTSSATYCGLLAAALLGSVHAGLIVMGAFGLLRGLAVLPAARVRTTDQLMRLSGRLEMIGGSVRRGVMAGQGLLTAGVFALIIIG